MGSAAARSGGKRDAPDSRDLTDMRGGRAASGGNRIIARRRRSNDPTGDA